MSRALPRCVVEAWPTLATDRAPYGTGLINETMLATHDDARVVLQRVHPAFKGIVNEDIEAITARLESRSVMTPRIVRTIEGHTHVVDEEARAWRVLTFVKGESHDKIRSAAMAREAGAVVARYHDGLDGFDYNYRHVRPGVHDTRGHFARLREALEEHRTHRLYDAVATLSETLFAHEASLIRSDCAPARHAHGDLKASNLLFDGDGRGLCLVDLDTIASMCLPFELGDALRSWCNPLGENMTDAKVDEDIFTSALRGYGQARASTVSNEEAQLIVMGFFTIAAELSSRFLNDALRETYFGFDASRFPSRGEHNLLRARGQASLASDVMKRRAALERSAYTALGR
jgi:Ser/Thr protein kinase RdoA (MazF antagonist)